MLWTCMYKNTQELSTMLLLLLCVSNNETELPGRGFFPN